MLPHLREIGIVVGAYFIYMYSRALVFSDFQGTALANARRVIDFEKSTGFFWEPVWQSWAIESAKSLVIFFNWAYIVTFFPIVLTASIVLYFTNRARYKYYRNVVLLSFLIALVGFMLFPLAPPRMIAEHFVDTINIFGPSGYASREFTNYYNAYAAMPSLHFGWTVMFGIIFLGTNSRLVKVFGVVYPIMTLFAITITANGRLDYFGSTINLAARTESKSTGGDIIISKPHAAATSNAQSLIDAGWQWQEMTATMKGFDGDVELLRFTPGDREG